MQETQNDTPSIKPNARKLIDRTIAQQENAPKGSSLFKNSPRTSFVPSDEPRGIPSAKQSEISGDINDKPETPPSESLNTKIIQRPPSILETTPPPKLAFLSLEKHEFYKFKLNQALFLQIYPPRPGLDSHPRFMATKIYLQAPEQMKRKEIIPIETLYLGLEWNPASFLNVWTDIVINGFSEIPLLRENSEEFKNWVYLLRRGLNAEKNEIVTFVRKGPVTGTVGIDILFTNHPVRQHFLY